MKKLLFVFLSLAVMSSFMACDDDEKEVFLSRQISEASVTYTVPIYRPSLDWFDYIVCYIVPDGQIVSDTISYENVISGKVSLVSLEEQAPTGKENGRAFWEKNETFTTIPDSCCVKVRMRYRSSAALPERMDLVVPQPSMTAVVRYTDGTERSIIGEGLNCNVVSVRTETELFKGIYGGEYYSTCTFYPSVQITDGRK